MFTSDTHGREQVADLPPLFNRAASLNFGPTVNYSLLLSSKFWKLPCSTPLSAVNPHIARRGMFSTKVITIMSEQIVQSDDEE